MGRNEESAQSTRFEASRSDSSFEREGRGGRDCAGLTTNRGARQSCATNGSPNNLRGYSGVAKTDIMRRAFDDTSTSSVRHNITLKAGTNTVKSTERGREGVNRQGYTRGVRGDTDTGRANKYKYK